VKFEDYYAVLEVPRTASADDIKKSYRRLSKQFHPDMNKQKGAEERFKKVGEAYEVLKDPDKRRRYDQLGANYQPGQDFRPPPGWGGAGGAGGFNQGEWNPFGGQRNQTSDFSDFFETFFRNGGGAGGASTGGANDPRRRRRSPFDPGPGTPPREGASQDVDITVSLEDAYAGASKTITLQQSVITADGGRRVEEKSYSVRIPAGTTNGTKIRLKGEGAPGLGGAAAGDLFLKVSLAPHDHFVVDGHDLHTRLRVAPWELALGAKVPVHTLTGDVTLTLAAGSQGGQKLRLKGKGLPHKNGEHGHLTVELVMVIPTTIDDDTRAWLERWRDQSLFDPRAHD
jgi:curved DNA-binding protein